ncbi:ABC transporter ATP-binding protein [Pyramidobacter sp.]|uniref:ABC transporter ATP-binding protein n=2 Tax=Pyramidobacter TaxID=638847 RepID=UPI002A75E4CB|nr:ABC transporter ATP-binding protein [Pyramidobacter sp.]
MPEPWISIRGNNMLKAQKLCFRYGRTEVLSDVDFSAGKGQIISLIGPNGSGKSTLLRCLCGLMPAAGNSVLLDGRPIRRMSGREIAKKIAFLPQFHANMQGTTVRELIAMGRAPYHRSGWLENAEDREKIRWASSYMNVERYLDRYVENLSGGEKQRVWIAMILAQDTPVVLLDEPVTYMDLRHQYDLLQVILSLKRHFHKTVVSVFHDINHAIEVSDRVYALKNGRVFRSGPCEQVVTEETIREVFQIRAHVCRFEKCCRNVVIPTRETCACRRSCAEMKKREERRR